MSRSYKIFIWKRAPFLRLLIPVVAGIIAEHSLRLPIQIIAVLSLVTLAIISVLSLLPLVYRFKLSSIRGGVITIFIASFGLFITWNKDARNHSGWYGNSYDSTSLIVARIDEQPVEKNKSYKALAKIEAIVNGDSVLRTSGKILLYFSKDSLSGALAYGDRIIITNKLQEIKNSGNPGAFDYKRYCAFQQIFQQAYLRNSDWILSGKRYVSLYNRIKQGTQQYILNTINRYISGKDEVAIAKALLIGYKADLDKDLVQQYSNAGVVHIIVIAGLHLGLIYTLLLWILNRIPKVKNSKPLRLIIVLICLWCFALLTGASPPVLRAVIMFSSIAIGKTISRNSSVYNSLAASAFILLCIDPFSLWDVGFQLSYLAVTGIVMLHKYIYHWFYLRNRILRGAWNIASVSLAAQIFTLPACLFYFHQMALLFMITNIIAVPLATITLYGCIALVCLSCVSIVATWLGKFLTGCIWLLNHTVFVINAVPFSTWNDFLISFADTLLLYFIIIAALYWLLQRSKIAFRLFISGALILAIQNFGRKFISFHQKKIIVYDVPNHTAIDFINGTNFHFEGDSDFTKDDILQNFHLKPSRILFHSNNCITNFPIFRQLPFYKFYNKRVLIVDTNINYISSGGKINVDYIILSKNPKVRIPSLAKVFNCNTYIFDASNPMWKIAKWKKDCEDLHLRFHSVPEQGAFVIDL